MEYKSERQDKALDIKQTAWSTFECNPGDWDSNSLRFNIET
jgi:hypothetical protein